MATIQELESFKLSDAVKFHKELNPRLWEGEKLDTEVRDQLLLIAEDFVEYLGLSNLKVKDVTISGSNAAYSYTPHSDLDLHILVDFNELPNNEVYQELFTAKKTLYNDAHDITVHGVPVELYVQDTNQPVQSLGEYSIVHDKWLRFPKKRRANFDQTATKLKYEKLGDLIELALKSKDPKRVNDTIALVKRYRKSGLDKTGEFGPENLAYKAVRKQGLVQALYDLKSQLHAEKMSIEEDTGSIADMIKSSLGLKQFIVTEKGNDLYLDSIIVDKKDQNKGLGTKALEQLISYSDQTGKRIILTPGLPNKEHGTTSRNRLVKFYKKFGFKENKGRSIDFAMGAGKMYRDPKGQLQEKEHKLLNKPTLTVGELAEKHGVSRMDIATQLDKGIKVELEHTRDRSVAREIALDHLAEDPKYYDKLASVELEEAQLDENAQESQLINLISKKAASVIFNMFRKNESKLMKILGPDMKRHNLEIWGIGAEKLGVPYVNDPILGSVLHRAKFRVANYVDPINRGRLASYDPSTHDVTVHFPAIMKSAGKFGYESEQYLAKIIAHELRHAVDNFKSRGKAFTTGKKAYPTLPYEINARFQEALMNMTMEFDRARKEGKTLDRKHLPQFIDSALEHNEISQFLPKTGSRYKRLANRAYKFFNAELENPKKEQPLSLGKRAINFILGKPTSSINESIAYHVTPTRNLQSIMKNGLRPQIGDRSSQLDGEVEGIFLFPSLSDVEAAVSSWLGDEFDEDEELSLLAVDITGLENNIVQGADYETIVNTVISPDRIKVDDSLLLEASAISMYSDWKDLPYEILNAIVNYYYSQDDSDADYNKRVLRQMGFSVQTNDSPDNYENVLTSSIKTNKKYLIPIPDAQEYCDKIYDERYSDDEGATPENEAIAWDEGWNAYESGNPLSSNPYKTASPKWDPAEKHMWDQGWYAAKEDPYLREALERHPYPYGYWIDITGEVVPVETYNGHEAVGRAIMQKYDRRTKRGAIGDSLNLFYSGAIRVVTYNYPDMEIEICEPNIKAARSLNRLLRDIRPDTVYYENNCKVNGPKNSGTWQEASRWVMQQATDPNYYDDLKQPNLDKQISEASGYIPSEKEKNDPRFKTALTVDVKPDSIKKNAKAFNWKTSRAGIPPQANPNGKIAEDLMREWKSFLAEDEQQGELFPGYDKEHREKRLDNWLQNTHAWDGHKPRVFYHATTKDFDTFNTHGTGFASALGMAFEVERHGSFFAVDPKFAESFIEDPNRSGQYKDGGRVIPVYLSIQNPIDLRDNNLSYMLRDEDTIEGFKQNDIDLNSELFDGSEGAEFVDNLQKLGFDGAIINERPEEAESGEVWVAFNPNQVKAIHNRGSFSPDDPRMMKESSSEQTVLYHGTSRAALTDILENGIQAPSYWGTEDEASNYNQGVMIAVPVSQFDEDGLMVNDLLYQSMIDSGDDILEPRSWEESLEQLGSVRYDYTLYIDENNIIENG